MTHSRASASGPDRIVARSLYARQRPIDHPASARGRLRPLWGALVATAIGAPAHAEGPNALEGTTVVYDAPAGCPSQSDFESRLRARGGNRGASASTPPPLSRVEARIRAKGKRAQGVVVITDAAGVATTRRIVAASCTEAVDALALIVALTLDPVEASGSSGPPVTPTSPGEGSTSSTEGGSAEEASKTGAKAAAGTAAARPAEQPPDEANEAASESAEPAEPEVEHDTEQPARSAGASEPSSRFGAFVSALVASGATPDPAFGGQLGFEAFVLPGTPRLSAGLGARIVLSQTVHDPAGTASFEWWAGFASMCAGAHIGSSAFSLDLCATFELGSIGAAGSNTQNPASASKSWQALGPALNAEWVFAPPLRLTAGVEGLFPFRHQRFLLGESLIHEIPTVALRAQGGVGLRF
jgi:hypothetical protein